MATGWTTADIAAKQVTTACAGKAFCSGQLVGAMLLFFVFSGSRKSGKH
jgi:hypothetical protein